MADERIEDISGGELATLAIDDRLVGLDASKTENHVKTLKTIASFCEQLASNIEG